MNGTLLSRCKEGYTPGLSIMSMLGYEGMRVLRVIRIIIIMWLFGLLLTTRSSSVFDLPPQARFVFIEHDVVCEFLLGCHLLYRCGKGLLASDGCRGDFKEREVENDYEIEKRRPTLL